MNKELKSFKYETHMSTTLHLVSIVKTFSLTPHRLTFCCSAQINTGSFGVITFHSGACIDNLARPGKLARKYHPELSEIGRDWGCPRLTLRDLSRKKERGPQIKARWGTLVKSKTNLWERRG